jgi:hypothetical protein
VKTSISTFIFVVVACVFAPLVTKAELLSVSF